MPTRLDSESLAPPETKGVALVKGKFRPDPPEFSTHETFCFPLTVPESALWGQRQRFCEQINHDQFSL